MTTEDDTMAACANCGKGEESIYDLKACTACKLVKYCNRECQIAHRPLHKKACKKRAAELHDEALFKEPPPREDCPICLLPLPLEEDQTTFQSCCGKLICCGCIYVMMEEAHGRGGEVGLCAFCRTSPPNSNEEEVKRIKKLMKSDNARAFYNLAGFYADGDGGMPQDWVNANKLWLRAGELGCHEGYCNLGYSYMHGKGVDVDKKKAKYYWELAAINGDVHARFNLGLLEGNAGNIDRAYKHCIIAAKAGHKESLDKVKAGFMSGHVTKDEYEYTLRAYHSRQDEMKSDDRDKAANVRAIQLNSAGAGDRQAGSVSNSIG